MASIEDESNIESTEQEHREEDLLIDILSGQARQPTEKELILQRMIQVLAAEYHFPLETMDRDVRLTIDTGKQGQSVNVDLVVYDPSGTRDWANAARVIVVRPPSTKPNNLKQGVALLQNILEATPTCEFGIWTNGRDLTYQQKIRGPIENRFVELSDFPGSGEQLDDLNRPDRRIARIAVAEDLRETVLRCHDYLYGNQAMQAPQAFNELVKLIFAKIYDEQRLRKSTSYVRRFWVGLTEANNAAGQQNIYERIHALFDEVKRDELLSDVFEEGDRLRLLPKQLAWVARELGRYQFLDAEVDVKGMAYEAMVGTTMKRERGQFFTPRNVVEAMVEILDPQPGERVLDPACGSGRFLVACLDRFRCQEALAPGPASELEQRKRRNIPQILARAGSYAEESLFGIDLDPELQRAAKMNMLINNDGHGNLFNTNSLEITALDIANHAFPGADHLGFESFDIVLTNPPFGAKIPIDDPAVLVAYDLGHQWSKTATGDWIKDEAKLRSKMPPEILFIERCLKWLKPGGRMGIVLPDGILGNPDNEPIRYWILQHTRVLASIDLPVESFLPQVGVQASLVFLKKKTLQEINTGVDDDYPIFMAVAEYVGNDRRGNTIFRRDPEGYELVEPYDVELTVRMNGVDTTETRRLKRKIPADDLPLIVAAYRDFLNQRTTMGEVYRAQTASI